MQRRHRRVSGARCGFTLIELLVVMSIISLLLSLLLPSLSGAMRIGRKTSCLANNRNFAQAALSFATDNDDAILGSPNTSGEYLSGQTVAYGPAIQRWDFMGPMAKMLGIDLPVNGEVEGEGTNPNAAKRFNGIRTHKAFLCASNSFLSTDFAGPPAGTNRMVSYNTGRYFMFMSGKAAGITSPNGSNGLTWFNNHNPGTIDLPAQYKPIVAKVGVASNKIFAADGARFSSFDIRPDHDIRVAATWGGAFSDAGTFSYGGGSPNQSKSWDRTAVPGNGPFTPNSIDARAYGFRHSTGTPPPRAPGNAYKANVVFFDGHAETLGDLEMADPFKWLPQGTTVFTAQLWPDAIKHFGYTPGTSFKIGT